MKAVLQFSNGSSLDIFESDTIVPIKPLSIDDTFSASMASPVKVEPHAHNGLIPSLMNAFCNCDYFYLNDVFSIAYCSKSIVSIETEL